MSWIVETGAKASAQWTFHRHSAVVRRNQSEIHVRSANMPYSNRSDCMYYLPENIELRPPHVHRCRRNHESQLKNYFWRRKIHPKRKEHAHMWYNFIVVCKRRNITILSLKKLIHFHSFLSSPTSSVQGDCCFAFQLKYFSSHRMNNEWVHEYRSVVILWTSTIVCCVFVRMDVLPVWKAELPREWEKEREAKFNAYDEMAFIPNVSLWLYLSVLFFSYRMNKKLYIDWILW